MSQSTTKKTQASLQSFFKPSQPASSSGAPSSQQTKTTFKTPPTNFPHPAFTGSTGSSGEETPANFPVPRPQTVSSQQDYTSSLSPPLSSPIDPYEIPISPAKQVVSSTASGRVVRSSDDEDEDSESSLDDLATLFQPNRSTNRPKPAANGFSPSTPNASRTKNVGFHTSPMPILNKHKFDLKTLASHAEIDRRTEASSKRVKAMQNASEKRENDFPQGGNASGKLKHSDLLQDVVASQEGADIHKVTRAVIRTEATLAEKRWYFFDTQTNSAAPKRKAFPARSTSEEWRNDLGDAQMRNQTFVSGFAEDMVSLGKALPDEIFLWILDEICIESSEPLRASYCNVLKQSSEQVFRLINPDIVQKLFEGVGATSATATITNKIRPVKTLPEPYGKRSWSKLRSLVFLWGQIAKSLQPRTHVITLLLRMCVDRVVMENVDIFDSVQDAINRLCKGVPDDSWESSCHEICTTLFKSVDQSTFRLQMVECTPSVSPRTHDLKRRLAMSFYFNDLSYSTKHSHYIMDLEKFIGRLDDHNFDTGPEIDYRELAALISLLDIALDDGRSIDLDLKDAENAKRFDKNIEDLAGIIKSIMNSIGNPGAAFISRIEAKEVMELVSQRISDTLRSTPKAKITVFDPKKPEEKPKENFSKEMKFMASHFSKDTGMGNSNSAGASS